MTFFHVLDSKPDNTEEPSARIFMKSPDSRKVQSIEKNPNVVTLKKQDKAIMSNYRPNSLTSVMEKLLKSITSTYIWEHLHKRNCSDQKHGFTRGISCLNKLLSFHKNAYEEGDKGKNCDIVVYLGLSKTFNKVPHYRFLNKIKSHRIGEKIIKWIKAWLTNHKQSTNKGINQAGHLLLVGSHRDQSWVHYS